MIKFVRSKSIIK